MQLKSKIYENAWNVFFLEKWMFFFEKTFFSKFLGVATFLESVPDHIIF